MKIDTAKMEAIAKKMEEAQKSGDPAAAGKMAGEMMAAVTGTNAAPIAAQDLKALLPAATRPSTPGLGFRRPLGGSQPGTVN